MTVDPANVAAFIKACAAEIVLPAFRNLESIEIGLKGPNDVVTEADIAAEAFLTPKLLDLLPGSVVVGEETAGEETAWRETLRGAPAVWLIDPIDGTSNFARGLAPFAVSVALLHRGRPVLAAVHCLPEGVTYSAQHRQGARRNRRPLRAPPGRFDDGAIVGCQWFRGQADMGFLAALQSRGARIRTFGSTVAQLCDAATGRLDANVQQQGRVWDFAAAGLIAQEAGLRFTDWAGAPVFPLRDLEVEHTATIAAAPAVHRQILTLLAADAR